MQNIPYFVNILKPKWLANSLVSCTFKGFCVLVSLNWCSQLLQKFSKHFKQKVKALQSWQDHSVMKMNISLSRKVLKTIFIRKSRNKSTFTHEMINENCLIKCCIVHQNLQPPIAHPDSPNNHLRVWKTLENTPITFIVEPQKKKKNITLSAVVDCLDHVYRKLMSRKINTAK